MKKIFLTILLLIMFFGIFYSAQAIETIVKYPTLRGAEQPEAGIPQYIKYIFVFSLGIVGIVALLAIIMAAFQYVTSAGNPQKAADAKDKIISALLGMILLLGSYVLLKTINPDLLKLKVEMKGVQFAGTSPFGEEKEGCAYTESYWEKDGKNITGGEINEGESANLVFVINTASCSAGAVINGDTMKWQVVQECPKNSFFYPTLYDASTMGLGGERSFYCCNDNPNKEGQKVIFRCAFDKVYGGTCAATCAPYEQSRNRNFCNYRNGERERVYVKGSIKVREDANEQNIPENQLQLYIVDKEITEKKFQCVLTSVASNVFQDCAAGEDYYDGCYTKTECENECPTLYQQNKDKVQSYKCVGRDSVSKCDGDKGKCR